jgi:hypothetical protein
MAHLKRAGVVALLLLSLTAQSCNPSPEAARARGGRGADIGNWGAPVEIHGRTNPSYEAPLSGQAIKVEQSARK